VFKLRFGSFNIEQFQFKGEKIFDFAKDVSPNIEYPDNDFLGWEKKHFLNSLAYFMPEGHRHPLMLDEIDDQTLQLRLTNIDLTLRFEEAELTALWWTLLGLDSFSISGLNVTAMVKKDFVDEKLVLKEFSSITFDKIELETNEDGIIISGLLRKVVSFAMNLVNKYGNFALEEFILPYVGAQLSGII
jgi:hypothetical protein